MNLIDSSQILLNDETASKFVANQHSAPFPKKSKIKPCSFKCNVQFFLLYSPESYEAQRGVPLWRPCVSECGNFFLYQKAAIKSNRNFFLYHRATIKGKFCFVASIYKFDNEAKWIIFSSFQYQVTLKIFKLQKNYFKRHFHRGKNKREVLNFIWALNIIIYKLKWNQYLNIIHSAQRECK